MIGQFYQQLRSKPSHMPNTTYCHLDHLDTIRIHGPDALKFLQGQCTQDVLAIDIGTAQPGAFCTAKGRAVSNCWIYARNQEDIYLICNKLSAPILAKHLQKYIAFFRTTKLTYEPGHFKAEGIWGEAPENLAGTDTAFVFRWDNDRQMLWYQTNSSTNKSLQEWLNRQSQTTMETWQAEDIRQQRLWLDDTQTEKWIPQNFSLDEAEGISFNKGCYTGQEVVARLHYKGQSKKRLYTISWSADFGKASSVYQEGRSVGDILNQVKTQDGVLALAILKSDSVNKPLWLDEIKQLSVQMLQ